MSSTNGKISRIWLAMLLVIQINTSLSAQTDTLHYSAVFKTSKPYRIFLPANYSSSSKRYPVIYYFHGNQGDHRLSVDGIGQLVNEQQMILVAWNGQSAEGDKRPYNVGYHSNVKYLVQFKDYFPELVAHIDSNYRTFSDRQHRALMGHSMGGFMSLFLAGKYPQLVSCAVR